MGTLVSEPSPVCPECGAVPPAEGCGGGYLGAEPWLGQIGGETERRINVQV